MTDEKHYEAERDRPMKAYFAWVPKLGGDRATARGGLVRAETASKARYKAYLGASDAFPGLAIMDVRVVREPAYDRAEFPDNTMPEYVEEAHD